MSTDFACSRVKDDNMADVLRTKEEITHTQRESTDFACSSMKVYKMADEFWTVEEIYPEREREREL